MMITEFFRVINYVNGDRKITSALVEHLKTEHRSLQQSFWRVVRDVAEKYKDFMHDGRNEDSVMFAKKISELKSPIPLI